MLARVARWQGGDPAAVRDAARQIADQAADGPPEGVPAKGFTLLVGDDGSAVAIVLFYTEEDLHAGDAVLNQMSPPGEGMGTRGPIEVYDVAVDMRT